MKLAFLKDWTNVCIIRYEYFPNLEVAHLIKQGSNHAPLLTHYKEGSRVTKNFWVEHKTFWEVVRQNWSRNFGPDRMVIVHNNLKKVSKALSKRSSNLYGDTLKQIANSRSSS